MTGTPTSEPDRSTGVGTVDSSHLLLVGAGPGLGMAIARRFAVGGYRITLVARSTDKLGDLAGGLSDTGAEIGTIEADAGDPEGLGARLTELYRGSGAPGVIIYNAVMGASDQLLSASVDHLQAAYAVDVISAIVVAQVAAPAMRAAGFGTASRPRSGACSEYSNRMSGAASSSITAGLKSLPQNSVNHWPTTALLSSVDMSSLPFSS
jgi:NAD(P)-dependent dehydrogenase (short-subunit alcohol dehydrogenase family)